MDCFKNGVAGMSKKTKIGLTVLGVTSVLLLVILVPLSFSYIEYYEYGIVMRKSTGSVNYDDVYERGRYVIGPDRKFLKYRADMHHVVLDDTSVFSSGGGNESVGIEFKVDIDFTYFLIKEKIGQVHKELASSYQDIVTSRARDAIKNEAASVKTADYFLERQNVEKRFREAIVLKWNTPPALPCVLDQLYLGRITISDSVAEKQLDSVIQNERNEMEASLQRAAIERELTAVEVNTITLQKEKLLRIAAAEANLLTTRATVEAARIVQDSQTNGTSFLFQTVGISNQEHMATFDYIRSLMNRESLTMDVSYLSADNVLRTLAVS